MSDVEYDPWAQAAAAVHAEGHERPRVDCPPPWARERRAEGGCNGYPGVWTGRAALHA